MKKHRIVFSIASMATTTLMAALSLGCARGYVETADLERQNQGPSACQSRCHELGMEMGALVLVANTTPACVCEPPATSGSSVVGASGGATGGHVVIAAAAAQAQQDQQRRQQQQQQSSSTSSYRR